MSACSKEKESSEHKNSDESHLEVSTKKAIENDEDKSAANEGSSDSAISSANTNSSETVRVIAKSENSLTDSEKQAIIEELSNEIDSLIEEVNNIEELE